MYGEQMEMFDDGGLKDQGGTKDKVSGNDVPSGSLKKEVRDDIPAMVSEGEFIFPADVVRYHGLDKLMQMRQEAKMGLNMMEKMGQLGNSEEAELPDDLPFTVADITVIEEEDAKMSQGGILFAQEGTDVNTGTDSGNTFQDMRYRGLPDIPSQADQERAEFKNFMGNTGYEPKGPRKYRKKNGDIIEIVHNYRDIPTQIVPEGAVLLPLDDTTPVTPKEGEEGEQATTAPKKKEKTAAERQAKADATAARNKEAIETSAKRLGMTAEEYGKLGFGSRLALMGLELKGARGETVTAEERNAAIEKSKEGGAFGGLLGGLGAGLEKFLGKIGFDVDGDGNPFSSSKIKNPETGKWEDPITGKEETEEAPLARPTVGGKNVAEANIDANLNMRDSDDLGDAPTAEDPKTTSSSDFISGPNPKNYGMPSQPDVISKPLPSNQAQDQMFMGKAETPVIKNTRPDALDIAGTSAPTTTTPSVTEQTQNAFDMSSSFNNTAGRSAVVNPLEAASAKATSPIGTDPTFTTATRPRMSIDLDLTEEAKRIEKAKAEEARAAKNREDSFSISSRLGKGLEGSLLSGNDMAKTEDRKTDIKKLTDEKDRKRRRDKRRKERDKQTAKERGKSYVKARSNIEKSKAKDVYKGGGKYGGFKKGGLMKRNYP